MATTVAQLAVSVTANTGEAEQNLGNLAAIMSHTGPLFLAVVGVTAVIAGIGIAATHMAGDFQAGLESLVTGAGESQAALGMINTRLLQMAQYTGTSTTDLINGLYLIESAGYHGAAGLQVLQAAAEGAKVGNADLATVANAVTTVLTDYHLKATDAAMATNLLIATVANGKTHMTDLAASISTVLPAAAAMHLRLQDVMAALATMTNQGTDAASAATYLRMTLLMLEAPSTQAKNALASVGLTTQQVATEMQKSLPAALEMIEEHVSAKFPRGSAAWTNAMKDIVGGTRSMQGILELTSASGMADFQKALGNIGKSVKAGGDQITGWNLTQQTFNLQMSRAAEAVQVLFIQLGQKLLPALTPLVKSFANDLPGAISAAANVVEFITQHFSQLAPIIGVVAGVIGGILVATLVAAAGAAWAFVAPILVMAAPFILVGAAIGLMVGAVIWAYNNWGLFRLAVNNAIDGLKLGITWIGNIMGQLGQLGEWLGPKLGAVLGFLGRGIDTYIIAPFQRTAALVQKLIGLFGNLVGAIQKAVGAAGHAVGGILSHIPGFATGGTMPVTGLAVVGEQGPELVQLPGGTQITPLNGSNVIHGPPSNVTGALSGASSGNQPLQSTFIIQLDGRTIAQTTAKHLPGIVRLATGTRKF